MEKVKINHFIQRYNLGGLIESVKWVIDGDSLKTSFISDDKSLLGNVRLSEFKKPDSNFGVYDTTKLVKMLGVLADDVDFKIEDVSGKPVSLSLNDKSSNVNYMLADLSVIPVVPDLKKMPEFEVSINVTTEFINKFVKATGAISDVDTFTFISKNNNSEIILGYSSINSNRISFTVDAKCSQDIGPISFSAKYLKAILLANKESANASIKISSQGLSVVSFNDSDYTSEYYLVEIK
jgi:hypothetical protein